MHSVDIRLVIGTRPEAIKLAPVAAALAGSGIRPTLIFTGQHAHLDAAEFGLHTLDAIKLDCPGLADPHEHVRSVTEAVLPLLATAPDLLVVQGDTSSALGAALAGFTAGVPVAHVEAGLRSHDAQLPWPEEEYRTAIDAQADLLFAPTALSAANLREEQVPGAIHVTGNSGIDALLPIAKALPPPTLRDGGPARLLVTCHRRESWSGPLESIARGLRRIAAEGLAEIDVLLHPNPHVARLTRALLEGAPGIRLLPPCSHPAMVAAMREASLVLSDSGGVQEEAPALGVPLLVLRDKTERPEALDTGNMLLVGTDEQRIVDTVRRLLADPVALGAMTRTALPYGDGHAAPRIAAIIADWLASRRQGAALARAGA